MAACMVGAVAENGHKGTFWGHGNVLYLDCTMGDMVYTFVKLIKPYTSDLHILLRANYTMINFFKKFKIMNKRCSWGDKWKGKDLEHPWLPPTHTHKSVLPTTTVCHRFRKFHWVPTHFSLPRKKTGMRKQNGQNEPTKSPAIKRDLVGRKIKGKIRWFSEGIREKHTEGPYLNH